MKKPGRYSAEKALDLGPTCISPHRLHTPPLQPSVGPRALPSPLASQAESVCYCMLGRSICASQYQGLFSRWVVDSSHFQSATPWALTTTLTRPAPPNLSSLLFYSAVASLAADLNSYPPINRVAAVSSHRSLANRSFGPSSTARDILRLGNHQLAVRQSTRAAVQPDHLVTGRPFILRFCNGGSTGGHNFFTWRLNARSGALGVSLRSSLLVSLRRRVRSTNPRHWPPSHIKNAYDCNRSQGSFSLTSGRTTAHNGSRPLIH